MNMDDEKISLRISKEELQAMDLYLEGHPEHGSRSQFIKNAIRDALNRDARSASTNKEDEGLLIRLPRNLRVVVDSLIGEWYVSPEDYISSLIRKEIDPNGQKAKEASEHAIFVATSGIRP